VSVGYKWITNAGLINGWYRSTKYSINLD
jgi:hypothetical protein